MAPAMGISLDGPPPGSVSAGRNRPTAAPPQDRLSARIGSPVGTLELTATDGRIVAIDFADGDPEPESSLRDPLLQECALQLQRYFDDPRQPFRLPLGLLGTPYLLRVWAALRRIPPGTTVTYGQLALRVGGSARSIGMACRRNPLPIIIPCHRVLGVNGLVGYCGYRTGPGLATKHWLLAHEGCPAA